MTEAAATTKKAKTEYIPVKMDDGRVVDFTTKRKLVKEVILTPEGPQVRLDFVNGETRLFKVPETLLDQFAAHGAAQKLGDEIAGLDDIDDAVLAVDDLMERLNGGEWSVTREKSGLAGASILVRALVEHSGKSAEDIKKFLANKTQAQKMALRSNPAVATIITRLEAAKKAKSKTPAIDSDALLAGLSGDAGDEGAAQSE